MTYRDDRDADRARIDALEAELLATKRALAEARGESPSRALVQATGNVLAVADGTQKKWYGPPLSSELRKVYDGELPADRFEELITIIRAFARDRGNAEILKTSVSWAASTRNNQKRPLAIITVRVRDGKTELDMQLNLHITAGAIYGGVGGGVGGGAIAAPVIIPIALGAPLLIPVLFVGWFGAVFLGCKALYGAIARRQVKKATVLFRAVDAVITAALDELSRAKA